MQQLTKTIEFNNYNINQYNIINFFLYIKQIYWCSNCNFKSLIHFKGYIKNAKKERKIEIRTFMRSGTVITIVNETINI